MWVLDWEHQFCRAVSWGGARCSGTRSWRRPASCGRGWSTPVAASGQFWWPPASRISWPPSGSGEVCCGEAHGGVLGHRSPVV